MPDTRGIRRGLVMVTNAVRVLIGLVVVIALVMGVKRMVFGAERKEPLPAPTLDEQHPTAKHETAVFAGGCFWGVQTTFQRIKGVTATTAGYSGGSSSTATYDQVSSETTGHAESV